MKISHRTIELTANLALTERETKMLAWLAGYGGKNIATAICEKLTTEFSAQEWEIFWSDMRGELEKAKVVFADTQSVFRGWSSAVRKEIK